MPVNVQQIPGEPIIQVQMNGQITSKDINTIIRECARLTEGVEHKIYRITDITEAEISLTEILAIANVVRADVPASSTDPRFVPIFVGNAKTSRLYTDILRKQAFNGEGLPFFNTMETALNYVREDRAVETV
jgi:hypothetical protein